MSAPETQSPFAHPFHDGRIAVREDAALTRLQRCHSLHVFLRLLAIEDVDVIHRAFPANGHCKRDDAALDQAPQNDLGDGLAVALRDCNQRVIGERVVPIFGEGSPSFGLDAWPAHESAAIGSARLGRAQPPAQTIPLPMASVRSAVQDYRDA